MIASHIPTWFLWVYGVAAILVMGYFLSVVIDVELWCRDVKRRKRGA